MNLFENFTFHSFADCSKCNALIQKSLFVYFYFGIFIHSLNKIIISKKNMSVFFVHSRLLLDWFKNFFFFMILWLSCLVLKNVLVFLQMPSEQEHCNYIKKIDESLNTINSKYGNADTDCGGFHHIQRDFDCIIPQ